MPNQIRTYTELEIRTYVSLLGCWTYTSPTHAVKKRDPQEYRALLHQLIRVNQTRDDDIGRAEIKAAKDVLEQLKTAENFP